MTSSNPLFAFRRFPHDPQRVLAAVYGLALVGVKMVANTSQGRVRVRQRLDCHSELSVAALADSKHRNPPGTFYDSKIALGHVQSLAHLAGRA